MSKYKYRICYEEKFWFELLPNNSNTQPVAWSSFYSTYEEALRGIDMFKTYMRSNVQGALDSEKIAVGNNRFQYRIFFSSSHTEFLTVRACAKARLQEAERRIRQNCFGCLRLDL